LPVQRYQIYGLDETYPELGDYGFKVVLNPRYFKSGHGMAVEMVDSDGKPMPHQFEVWGRKINVKFSITPNVSDGVSTARIVREGQVLGRATLWVIKP
jgi:hypothetical protein